MEVFSALKLYALEIAGTIVFLVFVFVEAERAIKHLLKR